MRYRKLICDVIIVMIFSFIWLHMNRNILSRLDEMEILGLSILNSSDAGYNNLISHGVMYSIFYLILLMVWLTQDNIQILVRKTRIQFILNQYKNVFWATFNFVAIFVGILVLFNLIFEDINLLRETNFATGVVIYFFSLLLYYLLVGSIFILLRLCFWSDIKAFVGTFAIQVVLLAVKRYLNVWIPASVTRVFDLLFENSLYAEEILINSAKIIILIVALFAVTYTIFKEKDVLHEKI